MSVLIRVDARHDPRTAEYRVVAEPSLLRDHGVFVAEGRMVVSRLVQDGRLKVRSLLLSEAAFTALEADLARLPADIPVYVTTAEAMSELVGFDVHRGCLALAERPRPVPYGAVSDRARVLLILEGIADPSNLGGIFRSALALGADGILLSPSCCDPLYRKAVRTSMAAALRIPFARLPRWPDELSALARAGFALVAMTPHATAVSLEDFSTSRGRLALVLGNEGGGLSSEAESLAHVRLRIPVDPQADSLNVAVAAAIALYRLAPRFREGPKVE